MSVGDRHPSSRHRHAENQRTSQNEEGDYRTEEHSSKEPLCPLSIQSRRNEFLGLNSIPDELTRARKKVWDGLWQRFEPLVGNASWNSP